MKLISFVNNSPGWRKNLEYNLEEPSTFAADVPS